MVDINEYLKTAGEYNKEVKTWTRKVRSISVNILASRTMSGSGKLRKELEARTRMDKEQVYVNAVGFKFHRYGAYREYGAGRGYVVQNGVIMRGMKLWDAKNKQFRNRDIAGGLKKKGYSDKELKKHKIMIDYGLINRSPLPWLDPPIQNNIEELADIAGEYHGDAALRDVLNQMNKITIKKNYGKK